jgi:2-amino-4-hydroxy-6-hydroxymethyldihydropteridine diphosphokinase
MDNKSIYLGLGTNRGTKLRNIQTAVEMIRRRIGDVFSISSVYITEPWGFTDDQFFLNQVVGVKTELSPGELVHKTKEIEIELGRRKRGKGYQSRTMDIDILFYADEVVDYEDLKIPHPLIQERKFVLVPLAEIAGSYIHPVYQQSIEYLLRQCKDQKQVKRFP